MIPHLGGFRGQRWAFYSFFPDDTEPELQAHITALIISKLESTSPQFPPCCVAK